MARVLLAFAFLTSMWSMPQGVSAQDESTCTATPDSPLSISAEAGQVARVTCVDGSFQVAYRSLTESDAVLTEDPSWVQESLATQAENRVMDSGTICRGISKAVDNRIATLDMTWYQVSLLSWHDGSWVNSVGGAWGNYYYYLDTTGWWYNYSDQYPYSYYGPYAQAEGWGNFGHSIYGTHEHHMVITFVPPYGCYLDSYHWGTLPNWSYWDIYAYIS